MQRANLTGEELAYSIFATAVWHDRATKLLEADEEQWKRHHWRERTEEFVTVQNIEENPPSAVPRLVFGAFTVELYLKSLHALAAGEPAKNIHKLVDLYNDLPSDLPRLINEYYETIRKSFGLTKTLVEELSEHTNQFPELRYSYEKIDWTRHGLERVRQALQDYIIMTMPRWEKALTLSESMPTLQYH